MPTPFEFGLIVYTLLVVLVLSRIDDWVQHWSRRPPE